jgi:hypothetical protein
MSKLGPRVNDQEQATTVAITTTPALGQNPGDLGMGEQLLRGHVHTLLQILLRRVLHPVFAGILVHRQVAGTLCKRNVKRAFLYSPGYVWVLYYGIEKRPHSFASNGSSAPRASPSGGRTWYHGGLLPVNKLLVLRPGPQLSLDF